MDLEPLADLVDDLSRATWQSIVDAYALDLDWGEVTITHTNLLAMKRLARQRHLPVEVRRVRTHEERASGADLEIWIQSETGKTAGFSIQAKRVYLGPEPLEYQALGHEGQRPNERQYDTLIRHAQDQGTVPLHLFYNGWTLPRADLAFAGIEQELYGCSIVPTVEVRRIRDEYHRQGMNRVERYVGASSPWSGLFRLGPDGEGHAGDDGDNEGPDSDGPREGGSGLGPQAPGAQPWTPNVTDDDLRKLMSRFASEESDLPKEPREGLPSYVLDALSSATDPANVPAKESELPEVVAVIKATND